MRPRVRELKRVLSGNKMSVPHGSDLCRGDHPPRELRLMSTAVLHVGYQLFLLQPVCELAPSGQQLQDHPSWLQPVAALVALTPDEHPRIVPQLLGRRRFSLDGRGLFAAGIDPGPAEHAVLSHLGQPLDHPDGVERTDPGPDLAAGKLLDINPHHVALRLHTLPPGRMGNRRRGTIVSLAVADGGKGGSATPSPGGTRTAARPPVRGRRRALPCRPLAPPDKCPLTKRRSHSRGHPFPAGLPLWQLHKTSNDGVNV